MHERLLTEGERGMIAHAIEDKAEWLELQVNQLLGECKTTEEGTDAAIRLAEATLVRARGYKQEADRYWALATIFRQRSTKVTASMIILIPEQG